MFIWKNHNVYGSVFIVGKNRNKSNVTGVPEKSNLGLREGYMPLIYYYCEIFIFKSIHSTKNKRTKMKNKTLF